MILQQCLQAQVTNMKYNLFDKKEKRAEAKLCRELKKLDKAEKKEKKKEKRDRIKAIKEELKTMRLATKEEKEKKNPSLGAKVKKEKPAKEDVKGKPNGK